MQREFIAISLPISEVKLAIYKRDVEYFREALLFRLAERAMAAGGSNWRCVVVEQDDAEDTVVLLFEKAPCSHPETILTHNINRLLEKGEQDG